jgi:hypothetical protein
VATLELAFVGGRRDSKCYYPILGAHGIGARLLATRKRATSGNFKREGWMALARCRPRTWLRGVMR